jgi:hypothetical protein
MTLCFSLAAGFVSKSCLWSLGIGTFELVPAPVYWDWEARLFCIGGTGGADVLSKVCVANKALPAGHSRACDTVFNTSSHVQLCRGEL